MKHRPFYALTSAPFLLGSLLAGGVAQAELVGGVSPIAGGSGGIQAGSTQADLAWHLETINWENAINDPRWSGQLGFGAGQHVLVMDTGIDPDHIAFDERIVDGANFLPENDFDLPPLAPPDWRDGQYERETSPGNFVDQPGHGTGVASVAGGNPVGLSILDSGGNEIGQVETTGLAPQAGLFSARVLGNQGTADLGYTNAALSAILNAVQNGDAPGLAALNLSLGTDLTFNDPDEPLNAGGGIQQFTTDFNNLASQLWNEGVAVIVASGNSGEDDALSLPAIAEYAFSVGASTQNDGIASFSNRNEFLDVLAPGAGIWQAWADTNPDDPNDKEDNLYHNPSGTSFAAPIIAGAIPLIHEVYDGGSGSGGFISREEMIQILTTTDTFITENGIEYPRFDLHAALDHAWTIPEPGSVALVGLGALALLRRRHL